MISYEDECVCCPTEMGCLGSSCPYRNTKHFICDWCDEEYEPSDLRYYENQYICKECYLAIAKETWDDLKEVDEDDE